MSKTGSWRIQKKNAQTKRNSKTSVLHLGIKKRRLHGIDRGAPFVFKFSAGYFTIAVLVQVLPKRGAEL
jgi:hypothetical protein